MLFRSILSEDNIRRYIELVIEQAQTSYREPNPEQNAILLAITDVDTTLQRWEEVLERGLLSLEDASRRIVELRSQREGLLKRKAALEQKTLSLTKIHPIPTPLMGSYIKELQARLREKNIGYKKEFLREILREIRVSGKEISLTYRLPLTAQEPVSLNSDKAREQFFTRLKMVGPPEIGRASCRERV